jgi:cell wall-associated NlpC family hydrolase
LFNYEDLLGKPFKYGGVGPDNFDCLGLCIEIYKRIELDFPVKDSIEDPNFRSLAIARGAQLYFKKIKNPEPFCIATFRVESYIVTHMGVVLEDCQSFIHILDKRNVCVEKLKSIAWKDKLDGFYKLKNSPR